MLVLGLVLMCIEMFLIIRESSSLSKSYEELSGKIKNLEDENDKTEKDISFYSIPENLVKYLREQFNYKKPGENMIIVVPSNQ